MVEFSERKDRGEKATGTLVHPQTGELGSEYKSLNEICRIARK